ncbi:MAG: TIGR00282 family metallophosphoesterase [Candidatus Omnitrophica bacterium]|nr:TIGR00282 family metallophosphoesterase [Candidatus Omnitrophota bacterium]
MKILFAGDIVGKPGRDAIKALLPGLKKEYALDFVIANAENSAGGSGITQKTADELFASGVNVITSGDHIWKKAEIIELINREERIIRPVNFPAGVPGSGAGIFKVNNKKVGVINVNGRVFMEPLESPFTTTLAAVEKLAKETNIIIVDIHAEATSEKVALGWYLDGKVSAVMGTHTHIQTADERILPQGTAYITDVGMVGPYDSVIGRNVKDVLDRFILQLPIKFAVAESNIKLCGAVVDVDDRTGKAKSIIRVQKSLDG